MKPIRIDRYKNADLIARAAALRPLLLRNAERAERDRRLPEENIHALEEAGLFRVMVPKRWGGYCAPFATELKIAAELAKGCPATGWIQSVMAGATWSASLLSDRAQEEILGDPKAKVCTVYTPASATRRVDGGYVVSGKWSFSSGSWHATWSGLGFLMVDDDGQTLDHGVMYVPTADLKLEDDWFVAGMRGTGSISVLASDVFVPDYRVVSFPRQLAGDRLAIKHIGERSDYVSLMPVLALNLVGPLLGIGDAVLELVSAGTHQRGITYTDYARQVDSSVLHHQIGEVALKIDSAWMHALRSAAAIDAAADEHRQMEYLARARVRGESAWVARLLREAVDELMSIGSSSSFAESSPLQRLWRDLNIGSRHAALHARSCLEIYGRALLGVEGNITRMI